MNNAPLIGRPRCLVSLIHLVGTFYNTSSGSIYKRNFGQQKLMYLVNNSSQIHQLLLTQLSLINRIGGSICKSQDSNLGHLTSLYLKCVSSIYLTIWRGKKNISLKKIKYIIDLIITFLV